MVAFAVPLTVPRSAMYEQKATWVVFRKTIHNQGSCPAVCLQREWEALERMNPGYHLLVRAGLASEVEAEKLARVCQSEVPTPPVPPRPHRL